MLVIKLQEDNYLANVFHIAKLRFIKTIVLFVILHLQFQGISQYIRKTADALFVQLMWLLFCLQLMVPK